jgi:hypothetical protein
MATQNKKQYNDDGDSGHFESAKEKEKAMGAPLDSGIYVQKRKSKKISTEQGRTEKYPEKSKTRKRIATKK